MTHPTPLQWCNPCDKYVEEHPLIHEITTHAPRYGRTGPNDHARWATRELVAP